MDSLLIKNTLTFLWGGTLLYGLAFVYILVALLRHGTYKRSTFYIILSSGFLMQGLGLYYRGVEISSIPLSSPLETIQVISWSAIFLVIIVQIAFRLRLLGFFVSGLAFGLNLASLVFFDITPHINMTGPSNPWIGVHAVLAIFAYGAFGLLAISSLMYLIQDYALKHKRFGGFFNLLASLKQLEELSRRLLLIGVVALTVAVAMGALTWLSLIGEVGYGKLLSAIGLLISYIALGLLKSSKKTSLRQCAWIAIILFMFALLSLWPVQL